MIAFSYETGLWLVPTILAAWVLVPLIVLLVIGLVRARERLGDPVSASCMPPESGSFAETLMPPAWRDGVAGQGAVSRVPRSSDPAAASGSAVHGPAHGVAERDGSPAAPVSPEWQPDLRGVCSPENLRVLADEFAEMSEMPTMPWTANGTNVIRTPYAGPPETFTTTEGRVRRWADGSVVRTHYDRAWQAGLRSAPLLAELTDETACPFLAPAEPNPRVTAPDFLVQR